MDDRISGATFLAADGVEDWRAIWGGGWALAHFRTTSYEEAVALAHAIGTLASGADHPADLDVRHDSVTVRLFSGEIGELSVRDVELARRISDVARRRGASPDPGAVQHVQIAIDAHDIAAVRPFWAAILGYDPVYEEDLFDALRRGPTVWFQQAGTPRAHDGAFHVDVYVPHDQAQQRIDAAIAAGGRVVNDEHAPGWWTLADAEGNKADVAIWMSD